jgi:hypothetical protein
MGYSKPYYALLDLKKVVISAYFSVMLYIEFKLLNYLPCVFCELGFFYLRFFAFLASLHIFCLFALESCFFVFSSTGFILVSLHNLKNKITLTLPKETTIYKTLIFVLELPIIVTFTKKALQIFCATNKCDSDFKKRCCLLKWMVVKNVCQKQECD